jgi:hypothetical protein
VNVAKSMVNVNLAFRYLGEAVLSDIGWLFR